eukprot:1183024-Amphidinium_carterae.1
MCRCTSRLVGASRLHAASCPSVARAVRAVPDKQQLHPQREHGSYPTTAQEWNWLRTRHVETAALVHFSTDAARAYGSDEMVRPGVPGHNAAVHTGPAPVFAEPQRSRVQVGEVIIDFVAHMGTQKLDSLWRWLERGVEACHRSDRASFLASLRVTQYQHWSHWDQDKLDHINNLNHN